MNPVIMGIVALYRPKIEEIENIEKYISDLDYCYLVDDSGEDNRDLFVGLIDRYKGKVEYYSNPENMGLCASVNRAIVLAMNKGADWMLIMNPDGSFANNAIDIYKEYIMNNPSEDVAIIAPVFNIDRHPKGAGIGYREIKYADMTGCIYNTRVMSKIGLYDPKTYFYGLDSEYCLRVRKCGYRIIECSEAVLNHCPATTRELTLFGKRVFAYGFDLPDRFYYQFRSAYYIHKKYGLNYIDLLMIYKIMKVILLFENKCNYFDAIKSGVNDAKNNYYGKYLVDCKFT